MSLDHPSPVFRPIVAAPDRPGPGSLGRKQQRAQRELPVVLPPKRQKVGQACTTCRRSRRRCGGQRPECDECLGKGRACVYEFEEGVSRYTAVTKSKSSRFKNLEKIVRALQHASAEEAQRVLLRIRTAEDAAAVVNAVAAETKDAHSAAMDGEDESNPSQDGFEESECESTQAGASVPASERASDQSLRHGSGSSSEALELAPAGSRFGLVRFVPPDMDLTHKAIEVFFSCSGRLFHVFSSEQVAALYAAVTDTLETNATGGAVPKEELCCLMAVAAVGALYATEDPGKAGAFYDVARYYLDDIIESRPYDAIKVCALLAQFNVLSKATAALSYVEIGVGLCRRFGVSTSSAPQRESLPASQWHDLRRTWRTLMFFNCWLESTLGYISGNDAVQHRLQLADVGVGLSSDICEIVQTELAKICILKADILRMQLAHEDLTAQSIETVIADLQRWYAELPEVLRIGYAGREDLNTETRRSILQIHLLYLGASMLLYRRIASKFAMPYCVRKDDDVRYETMEKLLNRHSTETVMAAHASARILKLLLDDNGVFKRCWLVIFQACTTCTILLHSVAQKQLHHFEPATWKDDMERAADCLRVLGYCATLDPVAARFHEQLTGVVLRLEEQKPAEAVRSRPADSREGNVTYLLNVPTNPDPARMDISNQLLIMLCQPFGHADNERHNTEPNAEVVAQATDRMGCKMPPSLEHMDWDIKSSESFQWDLTGVSARMAAQRDGGKSPTSVVAGQHGPNHFIGSSAPNGWAPAPRISKRR